jgi:hypothetical protein
VHDLRTELIDLGLLREQPPDGWASRRPATNGTPVLRIDDEGQRIAA